MYTLQYTYDVGSRVTVAQDPLSRYSYVYNQNDQVTKVTSGNVGAAAVVLDSVYDLLGRRTELKATVAGKADFRNTYQYDPDHPSLPHPSRPSRRCVPTDMTTSTGSTTDSPSVTPPPLPTDSPPNGMVSFRCKTSGGSDGASPSRRTLTKTLCAGVTPLCTAPLRTACDSPLEPRERQRSVQSDTASQSGHGVKGRAVSESSSDGVSTWQYDASSQVTAADHTRKASERYTYDATGNRTAATQSSGTANTITTGANNRLLADDRYRYEYDAEGNRTRRTDLATENYQLLTWDHRNRLTAVTSHTATGTKTSQV
ncbi:MAG: hypothetical protein ACK5V1_16205, partial [Planctomycetaceae bacterium]